MQLRTGLELNIEGRNLARKRSHPAFLAINFLTLERIKLLRVDSGV